LLYFAKFKCELSDEKIASVLVNELGFQIDRTHGGRNPSVPMVTLQAGTFQVSIAKAGALSKKIFREDLGIEIDSQAVFMIGGAFNSNGEGGQQMTRAVLSGISRLGLGRRPSPTIWRSITAPNPARRAFSFLGATF
jgi:hypothetical protein